MILSFDPGVCTGWAAVEYDVLIACGVIEWRGFEFTPYLGFVARLWRHLLVIEKPQVYTTRLQKGSQEDIVDTAVRAGMIASWARNMTIGSTRTLFPSPADWKGQTPKKIHNQRVLGDLTPGERSLIPKLPERKLHNCVDAIGLAKWAARQ